MMLFRDYFAEHNNLMVSLISTGKMGEEQPGQLKVFIIEAEVEEKMSRIKNSQLISRCKSESRDVQVERRNREKHE